MMKVFNGFFDCIKKRKVYFILSIVFGLVVVVLGVIAALNFGGDSITINLSNIAYIKFLKTESSFVGMFFNLILSLFIFFVVIFLCHSRKFLIPLGFLFYLYLIYSQTVVFVSVILIYGILNCIIFCVLLLSYTISVWFIFILILAELSCFTNTHSYFRDCCSFNRAKVLTYFIIIVLLTLIFSLTLLILKNYIILLIF